MNFLPLAKELFFPPVRAEKLCCTVEMNDLARARYLLEEDHVDPDALCTNHKECKSPLYMACRNFQLDFVELLITNKGKPANVNLKCERLGSVLEYAVQNEHLPLTQLLLRKSIIKPHLYTINHFINQPGYTFGYLLRHAVLLGNKALVEELIQAGADIDILSGGLTPLMLAVDMQNVDMCQLLLGHGCRVNAHSYVSPLHLATDYRRTFTDDTFAIVKLLLQHGARHDLFGERSSPILNAVLKDDHRMVKVFLASGHDANKLLPFNNCCESCFSRPNDFTKKLQSRLFEYAIHAHAGNCCALLLQWGFNVHYPSARSYFQTAANHGLVGLMSVLIDLNPQYLEERWVVERQFPERLHKCHSFSVWANWLQRRIPHTDQPHHCQPMSLQQYSRIIILQQLGQQTKVTHCPLPELISQLPLPLKLMKFISILSINEGLQTLGL